jgi:hypothetical protein
LILIMGKAPFVRIIRPKQPLLLKRQAIGHVVHGLPCGRMRHFTNTNIGPCPSISYMP